MVGSKTRTKVAYSQAKKLAANLGEGTFEQGLKNLARKDNADKPVMGAHPRSQAEKDAQQEREEVASMDVEGLKIAAEHKEFAAHARTQVEMSEAASIVRASRKMIAESTRDLQHTEEKVVKAEKSIATAKAALDKRRNGEGSSQVEKFEAAAREMGCDPDEDRFKDVLRKLAKPKS